MKSFLTTRALFFKTLAITFFLFNSFASAKTLFESANTVNASVKTLDDAIKFETFQATLNGRPLIAVTGAETTPGWTGGSDWREVMAHRADLICQYVGKSKSVGIILDYQISRIHGSGFDEFYLIDDNLRMTLLPSNYPDLADNNSIFYPFQDNPGYYFKYVNCQ